MSFAGSLALRASCSLASCSPGFVLPSGYAEWVRMEGDTSFSLSGSTEDPSAEDVDLDELSNDNSRAPLESLRGSKLEWSTVVSSLGGAKGSQTTAASLTQMSAAPRHVFSVDTHMSGVLAAFAATSTVPSKSTTGLARRVPHGSIDTHRW